ncbi:MAG: hypothetical protein ACOVKC_04595, partial [Brevundimonas sp.]
KLGPPNWIDLKEGESILLPANVAFMQNELIVPDKIELEPLQGGHDGVCVGLLFDQDAVQDKYRKRWVRVFEGR